LISPGKVSGTVTIIAAAARQFYRLRQELDEKSTPRKAYYTICVPISSMWPIHRRNIDMRTVYEPILREIAISLALLKIR
jgi:hypothetical protein